MRASSNTPTLVLRFEAKDEQELGRLKEIMRGKLEKFEKVSKDWDMSGH